MTMRRVDVNLDELDQIIDRSMRAPLSESEGQKLKTALHAMAERLVRKRSTEKTKAVLPQDTVTVDKPDPGEPARRGHGRNGAAAFTGANRVAVAHATLHSGDLCPEFRRGKKVGGTRIVGSQGIRNGLRWRNLWVIWRRSAL